MSTQNDAGDSDIRGRGATSLKASAEASPGSAVQLRVSAHRAGVLDWIRSMSRRTGAADPDELARKLAVLLDGAPALAMDTVDPDSPRLAHDAARRIIHEALP